MNILERSQSMGTPTNDDEEAEEVTTLEPENQPNGAATAETAQTSTDTPNGADVNTKNGANIENTINGATTPISLTGPNGKRKSSLPPRLVSHGSSSSLTSIGSDGSSGSSGPTAQAIEYTPQVLIPVLAPQVPSSRQVTGAAAVYTEARRTLYLAHPIFSQYWKYSSHWCFKLLSNALNLLLPSRIVSTPGSPSTLLTTVHQQRSKYIVHLLHYVPRRLGFTKFDVVTDIIPLTNVRVELRVPISEEITSSSTPPVSSQNGTPPDKANKASSVTVELVPECKPLEFERKGNVVSFVVPYVAGHQMVCLTVKP